MNGMEIAHSAPMMGMGAASVVMMAAMMLPSAIPAIVRRAHDADSLIAAPWFAASYLGVWLLAAIPICVLYRPPSPGLSAVLLLGAGAYELTPLKRACRRRCRDRLRSGVRFGALCFGSSIGLMLVLLALDAMSIPLMVALAAVLLVQKVFPPYAPIDGALALALAGAGVVSIAA